RDAHPSYSHDGRFIVFQSSRSNEIDTNVYRMRADGTSVVQLTNANGFSGVPVYSPDDNWIAFLVRETPTSKWRIAVMRATAKEQRLITSGDANDQVPNWSRDGKRIL